MLLLVEWYLMISKLKSSLLSYTFVTNVLLWIDISIHNKKFVTKIYDKRDDFNFEIIKYPSTSSNIHDSTLHAVFISQLIRYAWVCNNVEYFMMSAIVS